MTYNTFLTDQLKLDKMVELGNKFYEITRKEQELESQKVEILREVIAIDDESDFNQLLSVLITSINNEHERLNNEQVANILLNKQYLKMRKEMKQ